MKYQNKNLNGLSFFKYFKLKSFFALTWLIVRYLKRSINKFYISTIGSYSFNSIGKGVTFEDIPKILYPCQKINLGNNVYIERRCTFQAVPNSYIEIGDRVSLNQGCIITALFGVKIKKNTSIGEYTSIRDNNHTFDDREKLIKDQGMNGNPIEIGENCWIGRGCIILAGVTIGDGAIIAANSVVNKNIPSNTIYGGVPAKFIKDR
ncbi:acyltransferase [Flammeovirga yaeyamensis]|nr:acyltransferase [Flammeovirga yaeyamensis]MBB3700964.1 acetyltransferase-like isoleucine patch superfamily enzyme [Flammeovirga yaeyamensis]NMF38071.1 acyltransferase [Flammeovirga yaeyamensis]